MIRTLTLLSLASCLVWMAGCDQLRGRNCDPDSFLCDPTQQRIRVTIPLEIPIRFLELDVPELEVGRRVAFNLPPIYVGTGLIANELQRLNLPLSALQSVELSEVVLIVDDNSLEVPLVPVEFRVGPSATNFLDSVVAYRWFDGAVPAADGEEIEAGFEGEYELSLIEDNASDVSGHLGDLDFGMALQLGTYTDAGVLPQGRASVKIRVGLRFRFGVSGLPSLPSIPGL